MKAYLFKGWSVAQKECNSCASSSDVLCQDWLGYLHNIDLIYFGVNSIILYKLWYHSMYVFRYKEFKEAEASKSIIPVIAPQLRIPSSKVEDLQLCYSVQIPNGKQQINLKDRKIAKKKIVMFLSFYIQKKIVWLVVIHTHFFTLKYLIH